MSTRREFLCGLGAVALAAQSESTEQRFDRLLRDILIVDTHIDTPWYVVDEGYDIGVEHDYYETDIPRLRRGHVGAVFFGVPAQPQEHPPHLWVERSLDLIDAVHEMARRYPKDLEVASTAADITRLHRERRIAALISIEGGHQIQDDLRILRDYFRLGVRYMTLTHFKTNNWADSGTDRAVHNGLSRFGREVVREMNRLGMMVDISHVSDKTFYDAIEASRAPLMASHSSCRALCDIPRNMSDGMIRALAANGGVIFINLSIAYLDPKAGQVFVGYRDQRDREIADLLVHQAGNPKRFEMKRAIQQRYRRMLPPVDIKMALRHIDHVAKLVGPDHAGLGSDFDGISGMVPQGLEDVSKFPALVRGLIEMGYSDGDIRKIMGENLLRVMRRNEEVAKQTS
ncbi:MAG: membrane dipeptidase [Acidobacteria bacterium]|nr:membrane dipeptidase [Acidobacteriota bacterium]